MSIEEQMLEEKNVSRIHLVLNILSVVKISTSEKSLPSNMICVQTEDNNYELLYVGLIISCI